MSNECLSLQELDDIAKQAMADPTAALLRISDIEIPGYLRFAIVLLAGRSLKEAPESEVRRKFYRDLEKYIPGAVAASVPFHPDYKPDGFISIGGDTIPVEIKRGDFTKKAAQQLQRYVKHYKAPFGVAVAKNLTCSLPKQFKFVQVDA